MFQNLTLFQSASGLARHAGAQHRVIARNIAHADTPGFQAQRLRPFTVEGGAAMSQTRPGHLGGASPAGYRTETLRAPAAPNGNTVSVEGEMVAAVDAQKDHNRALAVYRHGLTVLRSALGRR